MSNFSEWILDALARESASAVNTEVRIQSVPVNRRNLISFNSLRVQFLPNVRGHNLFFHHRTFLLIDRKKSLQGSRNRIWLTHFDDEKQVEEIVSRESYISDIFVQNSFLLEQLVSSGFPRSKIVLTPGAVDRNLFYPNIRVSSNEKYFIFTGFCKQRKNPEFVEWIVRSFPSLKFVIHGNDWDKFNGGSLKQYPNLQIINFEYKNQGGLLRNATALISVAQNEGGPVSILESLACGTPVIATDTGFARDLIGDREGFVVTANRDVEFWKLKFDQLITIKCGVWNKDLLDGKFSFQQLGFHLYF
jgi:glycosyltransferase involved in cell wall biosynthesis